MLEAAITAGYESIIFLTIYVVRFTLASVMNTSLTIAIVTKLTYTCDVSRLM